MANPITVDLPGEAPLPAHVPVGLVGDFPAVRGRILRGPSPTGLWDDLVADPRPIYWAPGVQGKGAWIVTDGALIVELLPNMAQLSRSAKNIVARMSRHKLAIVPSSTDGPLHREYRRILNPIYAPKHIARMEQHARAVAREHIAAFAGQGRCEFMADFAMAFPIRMFLEFMGLPLHMTGRFLEWERIMVQGNDRAEIAAVIEQLVDLLVDTIAERRNAPGGEDLISRAIAAEYNGRRLDEAELLGHCCNLFLGGLDTITTHCGHIFDWLAHHPVEQDWLRRNPAAVADAVHELTRLQAMVVQERYCSEPMEIAGQAILPGDLVMLPTGVANRDPNLFAAPTEARFDRKGAHYAFGTGENLCLGLHLARLELRVAVEEFLAAVPTFTLQPGHVMEHALCSIPQPIALPLVW